MNILEETMLSLMKKHLKEVDYSRVEWSLLLNENLCLPRENIAFWVGSEGDESNNYFFELIKQLLKELNCPKEVLEKQQKAQTKTQGIRIDLSESSQTHVLYLDCIPKFGRNQIDAFHWNKHQLVKKTNYKFTRFNLEHSPEKASFWIHDDLKKSFLKLCANERILNKSGYLTQYQNDEIKELYVSFFWHPKLNLIIKDLPQEFQEKLNNNPYQNLHFRHIGFSTIHDKEPSITLYFGAPVREHWPTDFKDLQKVVASSSELLHQEIATFLVNG